MATPVRAVRGDQDRHRLTAAFDVAQLLSTQPVPAGDRVGDHRQLERPRRAGGRRLPGRRPAGGRRTRRSTSGWTSARRIWPRRCGRRWPARTSTRWWWCTCRRSRPPAPAHAAALRAAVSRLTVPVVTTFLAVDGLMEHLAVPDADGSAGRGSVPSYRTPERAVAALAHAVRYGSWLARPPGRSPTGRHRHAARPRTLIAGCAGRTIRRRALTDAELVDPAGLLRHRAGWTYRAVGSAAEAVDGGRRHRLPGGPQVLRRVAAAPDRPVRRPARPEQRRPAASAAYDDLSAIAGPWLYVQAMVAARPQRGVRPSSGSAPTRRSGRWSRSGSAGWPPSCSTTAPTGPCR